jgi:cellulose synthase (UDP-forming)
MNAVENDLRLAAPTWDSGPSNRAIRVRAGLLAVGSSVAVVFYFAWLLRPERVGNPILYGVLLVAELFNVGQALGFWWTCVLAGGRRGRRRGWAPPIGACAVDVFIPTYNEPVEVVEPTVAAAARLRGARVNVVLLDDGDRDSMRRLAARFEVGYLRRAEHHGAKAGNINHALARTSAPFVLVLDCDHVPRADLLLRTLPRFGRPQVAFVQTPQYYANASTNTVAAASWSQQALFFGPIARGKAGHDSMFCCGTNVVFRRRALEDVGGFPEASVTEDFELSIRMHERGWASEYVPVVLASGLGPEDVASYVTQQHRWARGCVGAIPTVLRSRLPLRQKAQYLLSASYFLSGWTVMVYIALPVIRIVTGLQPISSGAADGFLAAFAPYFALAIATVASVGGGAYTFAAYSLAASTFWIHVRATWDAVRRRPSRFVVTPKRGGSDRQWKAAAPTLAVIAVLVGAALFGAARSRDPATLNNVAFVFLHICVLSHGIATAVLPSLARRPAPVADDRLAV